MVEMILIMRRNTWLLKTLTGMNVLVAQCVLSVQVSRPICDIILKRLEGPTKDRNAY